MLTEGAGVAIVLAGLGWAAGWLLLWRLPTLTAAPHEPAPDAVVVVPARNEAASLPALLDSLAGQAAAVVVVDDCSSDATAAVAAGRPFVQVVSGAPPPEGWVGKTWALHQGVGAAPPAERVLFIDADVTLSPGALAGLVAEHARRGGLGSVAPRHRTGAAVERLSAVFNVAALMGSGPAWPGAGGRCAFGAFGPLLVCRSDDYRRVGGHAASPGDVLDDVALAARFRAAGMAVWALGGGDAASYRMYPEGLSQLVEGWAKNIAAGARGAPPLALAGVVLWVAGMAGAPLLAVADWRAGLVSWALYAAQLGVHLRRVGRFGALTPLAHPLLAWFFVAVFAWSLWLRRVRRRVRWRGREASVP